MPFRESKISIVFQHFSSMVMAITLNSKPRFKERQSRSFRSLQLPKGEKENNIFVKKSDGVPNSMSRFQPLQAGDLKDMLPKPKKSEVLEKRSSAAKNEASLQGDKKPLEAIEELSPEKLDIVTEMMKGDGPLTETDIQELLLSFTYTSGMIDDLLKNAHKKDNPLPNSSLSSLRETLKKRWADSLLSIIDMLDALQAKLFEYFWKFILYLNFWFPQWASVIRYVLKLVLLSHSNFY